jgi:hypothetical protein
MKPSSSFMLQAILNPPLSQFSVAATPPPLDESRDPKYRTLAFAASGNIITAATAKNTITVRFPGNGLPVNFLRQPGYLQETRGFPSLSCDRFGYSHFAKKLAIICRFVKHLYNFLQLIV